jgi:4'-phosphopantetheinyl transferase
MSARTVSPGPPRTRWRLRAGSVRADVWQIQLHLDGSALRRAERMLTIEELRRADRGTESVRRRRIALRAALRCVIADLLSCAPADVPLRTTVAGRPELDPLAVRTDQRAARLDVNCAADGDLGLVAVGLDTRVGVDVEGVPPWDDATFDEGWLTSREVAGLRAMAPADRASAATRTWTVKEAVLKGLGSGLSLRPASLDAGVHHGEHDRRRVRGWHVSGVTVPTGRVASLATLGPVRGHASAVVPRILATAAE